MRKRRSALAGMWQVVADVVADMQASGEVIPVPLAEKHYSGEFRVRIPPELHRSLALQAAEQGVSLNRLASAKLAGLGDSIKSNWIALRSRGSSIVWDVNSKRG